MHDPRTPSIDTGFLRMENDHRQSVANDSTKGVDYLGNSFTGVGCLRMADNPGTSSVSSGTSSGDSSLEHRQQLLAQQSRRPMSILNNCWNLENME